MVLNFYPQGNMGETKTSSQVLSKDGDVPSGYD